MRECKDDITKEELISRIIMLGYRLKAYHTKTYQIKDINVYFSTNTTYVSIWTNTDSKDYRSDYRGAYDDILNYLK